MKAQLWLQARVFSLCFAGAALTGDFTTRIVDGLGRPMAGVAVEIRCGAEVVKAESDKQGTVRGAYPQPKSGMCKLVLKKAGYWDAAESILLLGSEYTMRRIVHTGDLHRIAKLAGDTQRDELRELLAGEYQDDGGPLDTELVFFHARRLRPALQALAEDPHVGDDARRLLALIGIPEDLRWLVHHAPAPSREPLGNRWAAGIADAMFEPADEAEWDFLRRCALNKYDDEWVAAAAIRTLTLIGTPRSKGILGQMRDPNAARPIEPAPPVPSDPGLEQAIQKLRQAMAKLGIGEWRAEGEKPLMSETGDMARVRRTLTDGTPCEATFHRVEVAWKLRGLRFAQTMESFPPPKGPI